MNREQTIELLMLISGLCMLCAILMMIATAIYLNRSPDRFRIFELGYTKESEWYKTGKVDFFTANHVIAFMALAALRMRSGWGSTKARTHGTPLAPALHLNKNYEKFLAEFPKFVIWEILSFSIGLAFIIIGLVAYGMSENWW
jgi:hypothetical protein